MAGFSKRNLKRIVKKEQDRILQNFYKNLNNTINTNTDNVENITNLHESDYSENVVEMESYTSVHLNRNLSFKEKIENWYNEHHPKKKCFRDLLKILREGNLDVKGIIKNNKKIIKRTVAPGEYYHFGVKTQLAKIEEELEKYDVIKMDIGIDGLPLYKSSSTNLWPILGSIVNIRNINIILIGVYVGKQKLYSVDNYLHDFVDEIKDLLEYGLHTSNKIIKFEIRAFICDAPARSFICGIVGHNSFNGCSKCTQIGKSVENVVTYSITSSNLRTNQDFTNRVDLNHHKVFYRNRKTILESVNIGMVSQFPLDPMHLLDLGIVRKILSCLWKGEIINLRLPSEKKFQMSMHLRSLAPFIPQEFARKPRGFEEMARWKATEFRQFMLYTGICVFKDTVTEDFYYHFLLLHCAYRLLSCPRMYKNNFTVVEEMIKLFVENFPTLYKDKNVTYNVHNLLHLTESVRTTGFINSFAAYKFENYLQKVKKKIRKPSHILQQLYNKSTQENLIVSKNCNKCNRNSKCQIISYELEYSILKIKHPDNVCSVYPGIPVRIENFIEKEDADVYIICKRFINIRNFFSEPVESISLGILLVDLCPMEKEEIFNVKEIDYKYVCLPFKDSASLLIPLLHECVFKN